MVLLLSCLSVMLGTVLLSLVFGEVKLPEWLFPVRGKWLRYLLTGTGILLLLPGWPLWLMLAIVLGPIFAIYRMVEPAPDEPLPTESRIVLPAEHAEERGK